MAQRAAWTDERLDEKMLSMDSRLDRIEIDLRELRRDMNAGFDGVRGEVRDLRADISRVQDRMVQIGFGLAATQFATLIGVILAN